MALKLAYKAMNFLEAGMIASLLESHDIKAFVLDQHMNLMDLGGNIYAPVRVMVNDTDLDEAQKIIQDNQADTPGK